MKLYLQARELVKHHDGEITQQLLSEKTGLDRRQARNAIAVLLEGGFIIRTARGKYRSTATVPAGAA